MRLYSHILERKMMDSTMVGFGVRKAVLRRTLDYLKSWLDRWEVPYEEVEENHITVAALEERVQKDEMVRLFHQIGKSFTFKYRTLDVLPGRGDFDFVVMDLARSEEYNKVRDLLKQRYRVTTFPTPMRSHVSLLRVKKGSLPKDRQVLMFSDCPVPQKIRVDEVQFWNSKFQIDFTRAF
jgi:2'-5' RNA ligase